MKNRKRTSTGELVFNPKRRLREWNGSESDVAYAKALAKTVRYTGNPQHKRDPGDFNLTPPAAPRANATLCDDAHIFERKTAIKLLKDGARKGLVDGRKGEGFPYLIWTVRDGVAFEAQLENADRGEYHGYPMPTSDPLRSLILKAYAER